MSRARNLKPGFFKNERLAELPPLARILYQGLWCEADREGRLEDRPKRLKAEYLPYDDCDCDALLTELQRAGFIVRFVANGERYIAIPKFLKHQNPHVREPASSIPAPDEHCASTVPAQVEPSIALVQPGSLLFPPSPIPPPEEKHVATVVATAVEPEGFDKFWAAWPVHENKKAAATKWKQKRLDPLTDQIVADVLERRANHGKWLEGFIPHAATYLHNERWNDAIVPRQRAGPAAPPGKQVSAFLALDAMASPRNHHDADTRPAMVLQPDRPRLAAMPAAELGPDTGK